MHIVFLTTLARLDCFGRIKQVLDRSPNRSATIRHNAFQPVHLPDVPRNDVGDILQRFELRFATELGFVIVDKRV